MVSPRFPKIVLVIYAFLGLTAVARGAEYFASPTAGADGDGSFGNPWSLSAALEPPAVIRPGDTIWLRGGTYRGTFTSNLNGTVSAPILVRSYTGEQATLDGGNSKRTNILTVSGSYTWYWGLEILSSDPNRISNQTGSDPTDLGRGGGVAIAQSPTTGAGLKFINMIVHDTAAGFGLWKEAVGSEVYGCVIYYNGWTAPDRGHGHGVYAQNATDVMRVTDNIVFSNFSHGVQVFGSDLAPLNNVTIDGNTFFDNGMPDDYQRNVLVGGGSVAQNPKVLDNVLYYPGASGQNLNIGYDPYGMGAANAVVTGNIVVNGDNQFSPLNTNLTMAGHAFYSTTYGSIRSQFPANVYSADRPSAPAVFVRANRYEAGRANITVLNFSNLTSVPVDASGVLAPGAPYEIRNAQDFFGAPVAAGIYDGSPISVPLDGLSQSVPVGFSTPASTGIQLNVFVLLSAPAPAPRVTAPIRRGPRVVLP